MTLSLNTPGTNLACGRDDHVRQRVSDHTGGVSRVAPPVTTLNNESLTGAATRPPSFIKIKPSALFADCENNELPPLDFGSHTQTGGRSLPAVFEPKGARFECMGSIGKGLLLNLRVNPIKQFLLDSDADPGLSLVHLSYVIIPSHINTRMMIDATIGQNPIGVRTNARKYTSGSSAEMQNDQRIRLSGSERAEIPGSPTGTEGPGGSVGTARPSAYERVLLGHAEGGGIPGGVPPGECGSGGVIA